MTAQDAEESSEPVAAVVVQLPTKIAVMSTRDERFEVVASMRTTVGGVVIPFFDHEFETAEEAATSLTSIVDGWAELFPAHSLEEEQAVLPAAVAQTPDGERLTLINFGAAGWMCFDSLDPDGIYADWDSFGPALAELIDVTFNPV